MDDASGPSDAYELAYSEAVRALSHQQAILDTLRTRAGILLSAAAIATSFLGGQALRDGRQSTWSWVAIAFFLALGLLTVLVLWPRKDWEFAAIPRQLIGTYVETEHPLSVPQIHRDLALHMEDSYAKNEDRLERLIVYFQLASALLALEVVAWVVDLAHRT